MKNAARFAVVSVVSASCICGQPPYEWKCRSEENRLLIASCNALGHPDAKFVELGFCDHSRVQGRAAVS
jgi:hypothetical protein